MTFILYAHAERPHPCLLWQMRYETHHDGDDHYSTIRVYTVALRPGRPLKWVSF